MYVFYNLCFYKPSKEEVNKLDIEKIGFYLSDKEVIEKRIKSQMHILISLVHKQ